MYPVLHTTFTVFPSFSIPMKKNYPLLIRRLLSTIPRWWKTSHHSSWPGAGKNLVRTAGWTLPSVSRGMTSFHYPSVFVSVIVVVSSRITLQMTSMFFRFWSWSRRYRPASFYRRQWFRRLRLYFFYFRERGRARTVLPLRILAHKLLTIYLKLISLLHWGFSNA